MVAADTFEHADEEGVVARGASEVDDEGGLGGTLGPRDGGDAAGGAHGVAEAVSRSVQLLALERDGAATGGVRVAEPRVAVADVNRQERGVALAAEGVVERGGDAERSAAADMLVVVADVRDVYHGGGPVEVPGFVPEGVVHRLEGIERAAVHDVARGEDEQASTTAAEGRGVAHEDDVGIGYARDAERTHDGHRLGRGGGGGGAPTLEHLEGAARDVRRTQALRASASRAEPRRPRGCLASARGLPL